MRVSARFFAGLAASVSMLALAGCASGGRSARACRKMAQADFTNLFNLEGGITAWQKAGKPVEN